MPGYDIGASISGSSSAATSLNSPFSVTGGGGSGSAATLGSTGIQLSTPLLVAAAVVALIFILAIFKRR